MKILHTVEYYYPSIGGAQEVVKQLSERLVRLGHEVTVATTHLNDRTEYVHNGVKIVDFDISGNMVGSYQGETGRYQEFLQNSNFDVMMNYAAQQWTTDLALPILDHIPAKKVLVPCGFSGLYLPPYKEYYSNMKTWLHQYDRCVYLSNNYRDIAFARSCGTKNQVVIPNGAGADEFGRELDIDIRKLLQIPEKNSIILHVGSHTGLKGHREAIQIFKKANIKSSTLLIVANNIYSECWMKCCLSEQLYRLNPASKWSNKQIIIASLSREETLTAYKEAELFLFPSNIECSPIVLFECMASRTPFLTTDVGNAVEINEWSHAGVILPTKKYEDGYCKAEIKGSAKILEEIHSDPKKRRGMQESGYEAWCKNFTWESVALRYEKMYADLIQERKDQMT